MTNNRYVEEDFERELEKNSLYLLERQYEIEQEYYESLREPAQISIIKENQNAEQIEKPQCELSGKDS